MRGRLSTRVTLTQEGWGRNRFRGWPILVGMVAKSRTTLDEFLAAPAGEPEVELIEGEAVPKPMVGKKRSLLVSRLIYLLQAYVEQSASASDVDTELRHLNREQEWVFLPDISVTLRERLPGVALAENQPVEVMPDFAIEVLSPDDRPGRIAQKIAQYMRAGVRLLWIVDPETEQVTAWSPDAPPVTAASEGVLSAAPVLPGFSVDLEALFGRVREA